MIMKTKTLMVIFLAGILSACTESDFYPCVKPMGKALEETRVVESFTSVNVSIPANVFIEYGENHSLTLVAADNILTEVSTTSRGNTLYLDNTRCMRVKNDDIKIYITTPNITGIKVLGSGNVYVETPFLGDKTTLEVSGSGDIYFSSLDYKSVFSSVSGSGNIILVGQTDNHQVQVSGSGKVKSYDLVAGQTQVHISGSGSARLHVVRQLDARISGSGNIYYLGNPGLKVNISGSGSINQVVNNKY
jgi:hypothetical protein